MMPNIPNLPGVPSLSGYISQTFPLLISDAIGFAAALFESQWAILLFGIPIFIAADSFVSFEERKDYAISDYPVENGGFQSYNKVSLPSEVRVRMACGGTEAQRQAFLATIDLAMSTTLLYDVVTPEKVYLNYNFSHRDLTRNNQNGVGLIIVDLWLTEIRVSASSFFSNTQSPQDAGTFGAGAVQAATPSDAVASRVTTATVN